MLSARRLRFALGPPPPSAFPPSTNTSAALVGKVHVVAGAGAKTSGKGGPVMWLEQRIAHGFCIIRLLEGVYADAYLSLVVYSGIPLVV